MIVSLIAMATVSKVVTRLWVRLKGPAAKAEKEGKAKKEKVSSVQKDPKKKGIRINMINQLFRVPPLFVY